MDLLPLRYAVRMQRVETQRQVSFVRVGDRIIERPNYVPPEWITVSEMSRRLGQSVHTVMAMLRAGMPFRRQARAIMIPWSEAERWLDDHLDPCGRLKPDTMLGVWRSGSWWDWRSRFTITDRGLEERTEQSEKLPASLQWLVYEQKRVSDAEIWSALGFRVTSGRDGVKVETTEEAEESLWNYKERLLEMWWRTPFPGLEPLRKKYTPEQPRDD